jgi:hypothetical protein
MHVLLLVMMGLLTALLLQDVHWSAGLFGYFPTYSLGAMYACQIYEHAKQQLPDLEQQVAAGNFKPLRVRQPLLLLLLHAMLALCVLQQDGECWEHSLQGGTPGCADHIATC